VIIVAKQVKSRKLGRSLLLSVAIGTTPIIGLGVATNPAEAQTSATERALFDQASQTGNPALVNQFLSSYPDSSLSRLLLNQLPPITLQQVDRSILGGLSQTTLRGLNSSARSSLGIGTFVAPAGQEDEDGDGYAG
jgi:hypothetical protein